MRLLNIEKIAEGMVIAKNLLTPSGQCLVFKGAVVRDDLIKSLKRHKFEKVYVEDSRSKTEFTDKEIMNTEIICFEKVQEKFFEKPLDPMMKAIFKASLRSEATRYLKCKQSS